MKVFGADPAARARRLEWAGLGILVLAALAIRIYKLGSFPDTVLGDEADNAQAAVRILHGQPPVNGFFGLDWTQQPALSSYKEAAFIAVSGFSVLGLRLSSAVLSSLALIPFYLLLRRQFSAVASLLATALLATEVWYLNFSRSGWNNVDICLYLLGAMYFLLRGLDAATSEGDSPWSMWIYFGLAGVFCSLGLYGYPSGRAITVAVVAFFPVAVYFHRRHWKNILRGYAVLLAVAALTFAPQLDYIADNWQAFNGRSDVVRIFNDPAYKADPVGTMLTQVDRNVRAPWVGSVNNRAQYSPRHEPQLSRFTGLLVLAGMVLALGLRRLRRQPETWLWWLVLLSGWSLMQLLTVSTPNGARGIGYMPAFVYFAGSALDVAVRGVRRFSGSVTRSRVVLAGVAGVVALACAANVRHYVDWQETPRTRQDRYFYVTTREFDAWAASVVERAENGESASNVGEWREEHPLRDIADPYGAS